MKNLTAHCTRWGNVFRRVFEAAESSILRISPQIEDAENSSITKPQNII